jgi:branched-chain amino acid transport system permease protein
VSYFIEQTANALSLGGTYALLALGLAVVFSILGMINFAHGALMTLTGYALVFASVVWGLPFLLAAPLAIVAIMASAVLLEQLAFRPVRRASGATMLLTSFAVAELLTIGFQLFISTRPQVVPLPAALTMTVDLGLASVGANRVISIAVAVLVLIGLNIFLKRTTIGLAMRAAADDFDVTRLMGIHANRVIAAAFAISGLLAAIAAVLWIAQRSSVDPMMGLIPVLKAFIATTMGGLGSLTGAVLGGLLLGAIEIYLAAYLPDSMLPFRDAIALGIVIVVLVARPQGLVAPRRERAR